MSLFCNVVYVYVFTIREEKFGGCWWSFSLLNQFNPAVSVTDSFSSLVDSNGKRNRQLSDTVFPCTVATTV